jgi:hypothetical protein
MAIDVQSAVQTALNHLSTVMQIPANKVLLEEVELSEDGKYWYVTFSFPAVESGDIAAYIIKPRSYKIVKINALNGNLVAINIRKL